MVTAQANRIFRELIELDHYRPDQALAVAQFVERILQKKDLGAKSPAPN